MNALELRIFELVRKTLIRRFTRGSARHIAVLLTPKLAELVTAEIAKDRDERPKP